MRSRARRSPAAATLVVAVLLAAVPVAPALARPRPSLDARAADALAAQKPSGSRRHALEGWARNASLDDLMWVLRRPASELSDCEAELLRAALRRCPPARAALRRRLAGRMVAEVPGATIPPAARGGPAPVLDRPAASVFRIGVLLPDSGDYADFARDLRFGLEAGLARGASPGGHAPQLEFWSTGDDDPARGAQALESSSLGCGALVGELLSVNTLALATGARLLGTPMISPTATDESIGALGPGIFQIGPSGWARGERLARAMIDHRGMRVGWLVAGSDRRSPVAMGFAAAAESLAATVAWGQGYPSGTAFRDEVRAIATQKLDVLLWDGDPREAEALVRELTRQKVSVRLCGGEGLAPDRMHADLRPLLEGVRYVADEWRLPPATQAALDSVAIAHGGDHAGPLYVRGWLTGRALAAALASGALCPEELAAALRTRCGPPPWLGPRHFLDVARDGATLAVTVVQRGRATPFEP